MNISLGEAAAADYKHIRKLYKKAFPIEERELSLMIKKNAMILAEEYDGMISSWAGKWIRKIVDMRIIE